MRARPLPFAAGVPRASSRLATLTQAISSTKPTAPMSSHMCARVVVQKIVLERFHAGGPIAIRAGIDLRDVPRHSVHVGLRLLQSDARLSARQDEEPVEIMVDLFRLEHEGQSRVLVKPIGGTGCSTPTTV